ncbi:MULTISPECIES: hypothetical protein [Bacillus cereus group]|uniref:hypothetical protein n=1 Tax=Bacillus cereus group TaxID=86661 RepID=UPI0011454E17|nr:MULTISPECIES: hypothetical protein [Bacillus cereus group]
MTNSDCIIITIEWDEFKILDWQQVKKLMRGCKIVNDHNYIEQNEIVKHGLLFIEIGRP